MVMNEGLYTSKTAEYATPQGVFDRLNEEFHFTLDPCATPKNTKCPLFFTKEQDGLSQVWGGGCFYEPSVWPGDREVVKKGL